MNLSIIVPTYNSRNFISKTLDEFMKFSSMYDEELELIIVDDGSIDGTFEVIKDYFSTINFNLKLIQLFRNKGQACALIAGLEEAEGRYVVTIDDDLEYDPSEIKSMVDNIKETKLDVVLGVPKRDKRSLVRKAGSHLQKKMNVLIFGNQNIRHSSFRVMTGSFAKTLLSYRTSNPTIGNMIFKLTRRVGNLQVKTGTSLRGSNYSFFALVGQFLRNIQNHTVLPINYIASVGMVLSMLAFLVGIFIGIQYITGFPWEIKKPGWSSIVLLISFFSGGILFSIA